MAPDDDPAIDGSESAGDARTVPVVADQGKDVIDARGRDVGVVSDVEGDALYVDPDPSLTEAIMSKLHWREGDRDDLEVPADRIRRIGDEVILDAEYDRDPPEESDPGSNP